MRTNKDYEELAKPIDLIVHTKVPTKWILIDRETGQAYVGNKKGHWDKLIPKDDGIINT
jgi:hypothetical protein